MSKGADDGLNHDLLDDKGGLNNSSSDDNPTGSGNHKSFKFTIENGQVTTVFEFKDGVFEQKNLDVDETYTVSGKNIIHTEQKPFGTETTILSDPEGDGIYTRFSESVSGGNFKYNGSLVYRGFDSSDDNLVVRGDESCHGGSGSDSFYFREASHLEIEDFHHVEHDKLVFDTGLGLQSKEHLASFITDAHFQGDDFIINLGPDVSIKLVGVHDGLISWDDVTVLS